MGALRNLSNTVSSLGISMTRLSTGLRINTGADDPAGLIISEGMRSQLKGLDQAVRNAQDAVNMAKTAESALDEVQRLLRNMRGLAVHAANSAVVDTAQLQADQSQIRSTLQSIDRVATQTSWGSKNLLDGTAGAMASITDTADVSSMFIGGTFNGQTVATGPVTLVRTTAATQATATLAKTFAASTTLAPAGSFVVNGYTFTTDGTETITSVIAKMNNMSSTTGVTASLVPSAGNFVVQLTSNQYGANFPISVTDPSNVIHNASSANANGTNAVFQVTANTAAGAQTVTFTGGQGPKESGLRLTDSFGNSILLNAAANTAAGFGAGAQIGVITAGSVRFQIGPNANQSASFSMPTVFSANLGTGAVAGQNLSTIDLTTYTGAQNAIRIVDAAITQLAQMRGDLGSFQANFLESTVRSLDVTRENLTSAESQIRDADIAAEMTEFTKLQVLQQSGMSILAQANQQPQSVLSLLRGQ